VNASQHLRDSVGNNPNLLAERLVVLVVDLTHDLFENILERDQPLQAAIFVHDQRKMRAARPEVAHLVVQRCRLGDEIGLHRDVEQVEIFQLFGVKLTLFQHLLHRAQQFLGMQDTDHVLGLFAVKRQAGMRAFQDKAQNLHDRQVGVDHLDIRTVHHDLFDGAFAQVERAQDAVAMFLFDDAFGMAQLDRPGNLLADGQDVGVGIGAHPEQGQHGTHKRPDGADDRSEQLDDDRDRPRHKACGPFGIGDGIGLGQDLGEDQHEDRHDQRRQRHAGFAERAGEQGGGQRCGQDVDQVVAQQHRADQTLAVLGQFKRAGRALVALVGIGAQFPARSGCQRRFRPGKEPGHEQQRQNGARGDPEGSVKHLSAFG